MVDRLLAISFTLLLAACPADGPIVDDDPDGGDSNADTETPEPDGGDEEGLELASLEPTDGPVAGGTEVALSGDGFVEGMTVRFGSGAAVDATVASPTEATVTTPTSTTTGAVAVVVRNPDGETDSLLNGFTYVGDVEMPEIGFCQLQAQSPVSATTGVATDGIFAVVFAEGVTNAEGQGSGIEGELGWGADDAHEDFNFVPMTYNLDADGLNPGDISNDEYGAALTIPMSGSFKYVARFRMADADVWTYCDLDGSDNGVAADQLGIVEVSDPPEPTVGYCQTAPPRQIVETGQSSGAISGTVFVAGETVGAGAGDVTGEIIWGDASLSPADWTEVATASYDSDADGLTPGDQANDVWSGTIAPATEGDYGYAFRFSADGGSTWQLCDLDGATGADDFDENNVGLLEVRDDVQNLPDACNLQFPHLVEAGQVGTAIAFFGRVTEAGVTGMGSAGAVMGELLVGPVGMDPRPDATGFEVVNATYNANTVDLGPDEDEYTATYTPADEGEFSFAFRFSVDGGTTWSFCGLDDPDATGGFGPDTMGWLAVTDGTPDVIDFCHVWQDTLDDDVDPNNIPVVTVEVFEAGLTDSAADPADIEAEVTFAPLTSNPAIASLPWQPMPYKGPRPGVPQNYEYEGAPYTPALHPGAGMYNVVARVREAGSTLWTYCDTDETASEFRLDAATRLTVSP